MDKENTLPAFLSKENPLAATDKAGGRFAIEHIGVQSGTVYATNGRILAAYPGRAKGMPDCVIPRCVVEAATKGAHRAPITVAEGAASTWAKGGGNVAADLVGQDFPQCKAVISTAVKAEDAAHSVTLDAALLLALAKALGASGDRGGKVVTLHLSAKKNAPVRVETEGDTFGLIMPVARR